MGSSVRSLGREAPGPGVRCTRPEEELAFGVSLRLRGTTVSPFVGSHDGGLGMTSDPKTEVFRQRRSQKVPEGQICCEATVLDKLYVSEVI